MKGEMSMDPGTEKKIEYQAARSVQPDPATGYFQNIDDIRRHEYPHLQGKIRFSLHKQG